MKRTENANLSLLLALTPVVLTLLIIGTQIFYVIHVALPLVSLLITVGMIIGVWIASGTGGLALMGIGGGFNIPAYWTAGTLVSGAFFGDEISPLSDTTNLAPAVT
ncbi:MULTISPECIES: hypothetical protein [unclassified Colwellia]|uniref:hypothetical protein n=1 Tax=unclassified Colwellia TaxID=196834 RepID=UPI0021752EAF|nr:MULTISPECIES: hypothetical protein [unclassified Colwellia]